jgi:hypothetical protein
MAECIMVLFEIKGNVFYTKNGFEIYWIQSNPEVNFYCFFLFKQTEQFWKQRQMLKKIKIT